MCGCFQLIKTKSLTLLMKQLGVTAEHLNFHHSARPGSKVSIILDTDAGREIKSAIWWLLLEAKTGKPNYHYASFNSRWDKLQQPRALAYRSYRSNRCLIPATAFVEGLGDKKTYHKIELQDQAIAFGGLYRYWHIESTGEILYSASIITLAAHPKWQHIHPKSMPLMIPMNEPHWVEQWLDPKIQDVARFESLLKPKLAVSQVITPIDRPSTMNVVGKSFKLAADD